MEYLSATRRHGRRSESLLQRHHRALQRDQGDPGQRHGQRPGAQQLVGLVGAGPSPGHGGRQYPGVPRDLLGAAAAERDQLLPHVAGHHGPHGGHPGDAAGDLDALQR